MENGKGAITFTVVLCLALVFGFFSLALAQTIPTIPATPAAPASPAGPSTPDYSNPTQYSTPQSLLQQQQAYSNTNATATSGQGTATASSGNLIFNSDPSSDPRYSRFAYPVPGVAGFAYIPSYFGPATADVNWQTMRTMTAFKLDWSASDAQALLEGIKPGFVGKLFKHPLKSRPKCFYGTMSDHPVGGVLRVAVNGNNVKEIKDMTLIGTNDVWANNVETTTREVLGQAIYDGLCMNADVLLVTGEGAAVVMRAFGWGVGINNSVSVISGGIGNAGNVTAAGIGVSGVEAGYRSKPWLQVLYFKSVAGAAPPPPAVAPPPPRPRKPKS